MESIMGTQPENDQFSTVKFIILTPKTLEVLVFLVVPVLHGCIFNTKKLSNFSSKTEKNRSKVIQNVAPYFI